MGCGLFVRSFRSDDCESSHRSFSLFSRFLWNLLSNASHLHTIHKDPDTYKSLSIRPADSYESPYSKFFVIRSFFWHPFGVLGLSWIECRLLLSVGIVQFISPIGSLCMIEVAYLLYHRYMKIRSSSDVEASPISHMVNSDTNAKYAIVHNISFFTLLGV